MASNPRSASAMGTNENSYFEQQREALIGEIAMNFEQVLANINKLNRSLEAVIAVGNEFSSVEALWSQFESVMDKDGEAEGGESAKQGEQQREQQQHEDEKRDEARK
ncbi:DASH complex subunit Dad1-domain-containing protein [Dactylonectria estremocensis]|uniref:DASH complex subunit DAD1 n=1 Tax=Dactylonectria estremocensis TaxID=1079267 RepID=A0A9P9F8G4_9HYPO|nr:DASH complex subunit Dad1-domain-containing protein [Dactylonectria estremocensis]